MNMQTVWYVLIHISLGLIGWQVFTITNQGVLAALAVCGSVQAWPMYEFYKLSWDKFDSMRSGLTGAEHRKRETRGYWTRMGRLWLFRSSAYSLLTLFVAWLLRG
jgi:hypothetical protein